MSNEKGPSQLAVKDLPIYTKASSIQRHSPTSASDGDVLGQDLVAGLRSIGRDFNVTLTDRIGAVNRSLEPAKNIACAAEDYVRREKDLFPRASAITVGGMLGFVMAMRRGGKLRRALYSLTGALTVAAFCYPRETVHVVRTGIAHSKMTWENFKQSPDPKMN